MEVEFNWRRLILISVLAALVLAGFYAIPRLLADNRADTSKATPTVSPEGKQKVVASDLEITFDNRSSWKIDGVDECLPKLRAWIGERYPLKQLTIVVTNTVSPDMVIGVLQSDEQGGPDAMVKGKYETDEENQRLTITIAVEQGEPGASLDVAATVETALLVQDYFRPRTKEAWEKQQNGLEQFQPLIRMEEGQWISDCLSITR